MRKILLLILLPFCLLGSGCSYIIENQTNKAAQHLSDTLLNYEDPATVSAAIPAFLLLIDSIANSDNASANSQLSAAQMYGAYSSAFVTDNHRQKILTTKAFSYAQLGCCQKDKKWCALDELNQENFANFAAKLNKKDSELTYAYAAAWLSYIQSHGDDWNVIADLSKAKLLLESVVTYNETYDNAGAHLYLAAIASSLPPALGGQPDVAKYHFDRAIELTDGRHLLLKVEYARRYARLIFDKELHHRLLTEVLTAEPKQEGLTLMNTWAQQEAKKLLDDEDRYFD